MTAVNLKLYNLNTRLLLSVCVHLHILIFVDIHRTQHFLSLNFEHKLSGEDECEFKVKVTVK